MTKVTKPLAGVKHYNLLNGKTIIHSEVIENLNKELISKLLDVPYWKFEEQFYPKNNE